MTRAGRLQNGEPKMKEVDITKVRLDAKSLGMLFVGIVILVGIVWAVGTTYQTAGRMIGGRTGGAAASAAPTTGW